MYIDKWTLVVCIVVGLLVLGFLRKKSFDIGMLAGARQAVTDLSRACSVHYERDGQSLPESVDKALTYKRGKGPKEKLELYLVGAGMLGDAMGEWSYARGVDAGRMWMQPSNEEIRVDMTAQEIRTLAWLADIGFHRVIEGGHVSEFRDANDAEAAANAVQTLEANVPPIEGIDNVDDDSRYDSAWYRQTSIWDRWPTPRAEGTS